MDLQGCAWLVRLLPELAAAPIEPLPAWRLAPEQERRLMFGAAARFLGNRRQVRLSSVGRRRAAGRSAE